MDKDKKIEIQQKLIEQLTKENNELKESSLHKETQLTEKIINHEKAEKEYLESKNRYEELVKELEKQRKEYRMLYEMYRKLTE